MRWAVLIQGLRSAWPYLTEFLGRAKGKVSPGDALPTLRVMQGDLEFLKEHARMHDRHMGEMTEDWAAVRDDVRAIRNRLDLEDIPSNPE